MKKEYTLEELLKLKNKMSRCPSDYTSEVEITCSNASTCSDCWTMFLAYKALKESLDIIHSLCEYVSNSPCGCDACGFVDDCEYDEDGNKICAYSKHKNFVKEVIGMYNLVEDEV